MNIKPGEITDILRREIAEARTGKLRGTAPHTPQEKLTEWELEKDEIERQMMRQLDEAAIFQDRQGASFLRIFERIEHDVALVEFVHFQDIFELHF